MSFMLEFVQNMFVWAPHLQLLPCALVVSRGAVWNVPERRSSISWTLLTH